MATFYGHYRFHWVPKVSLENTFNRRDDTYDSNRQSQSLMDWVKVLQPYQQGIGHFGDVLPSQSLGVVLKKLSQTQQKQAAQEYKKCVMRYVTTFVSRGMGVIKVSNSKSHLQRHSRILAMVPFDRPHTISY